MDADQFVLVVDVGPAEPECFPDAQSGVGEELEERPVLAGGGDGVQAVHLRSIGARAAAGAGVRLSEVPTRDSAANRPHSERVTKLMHPTGSAAFSPPCGWRTSCGHRSRQHDRERARQPRRNIGTLRPLPPRGPRVWERGGSAATPSAHPGQDSRETPQRAEKNNAMSEDADSYTPEPRSGFPRIRAGAVIAVALLAGFLVWLLVVRDDDSSSSSGTTTTSARAEPVPITPAGLRTLASAVGRPIYWAGPKSGVTYELTKTDGDRVFIRYLPKGVATGSSDPYLTIGTYPLQDAFAVTRRQAQHEGSVKVAIGGGGIAFYSDNSPANVYFAYPRSDYQIEVYDPSPARARQLVSSGQVSEVPAKGATTSATPHVISLAKLKSLSDSVGHPVYWAGPQQRVTLESTETSDGRVFLRYLPRGVEVGSDKPYLTIGTYPVQDAFAVTQAQSRKADAVVVEASRGAVAFYARNRPTNVYVAYPDANVQIEVYDPNPARARNVVVSDRLKPVG